MPSRYPRTFRSGRSTLAVVIYLVGFSLLLWFVSRYYLIPTYDAARSVDSAHANDPASRKLISAYASLILALVLFILLMGLMLTFRVSRFFRPRQTTPHKPTEYVDAWEESARRLKTPEMEDDAE